MCHENEVRAHILKLVIRSEGTFKKYKQRKFLLPSNIRSQLHVEFVKERNQLNEETATQLASCFPSFTIQQVIQLFESWVKQSKKLLIAPPTISLS